LLALNRIHAERRRIRAFQLSGGEVSLKKFALFIPGEAIQLEQ